MICNNPSLLAIAATIVPGCMNGMDHGQFAPLAPLIRLSPAVDLTTPSRVQDENPDPKVVEFHLTAAVAQHAYLPQKPASVWAFNGTIPGPLIEANRGDRVIVHFKNDLPEATTIHWHGVRVPNDMDGAGRMLRPIPPGGTFDYDFIVPDEGLFWYHPHVRSDVQVEKGLYGPIVVRDPGETSLGVGSERVLVLDDVSVDSGTGQTSDSPTSRHKMMGREGNLLLANGQPANALVAVVAGERVRLRIVNAANARYFKLKLEGAPLTKIGADGGLLRSPRAIDDVVLVPGERADLVFVATGPVTLKAIPYARARGVDGGETMDLVRFLPGDSAPVVAPTLPSMLRSIESSTPHGASRKLVFDERMIHHGWQFTINGRVFPNVPMIDAAFGSREVWTVRNDSDMDHPFHLHGFFFQQMGIADWKDTINVPGRAAIDLVVDFALRPGAAGEWMYHCHILEHAEGGMMGEVRIK